MVFLILADVDFESHNLFLDEEGIIKTSRVNGQVDEAVNKTLILVSNVKTNEVFQPDQSKVIL